MSAHLLGIFRLLANRRIYKMRKVIRTPSNAIHKSPMKSALVKCLSWASRAQGSATTTHSPRRSISATKYAWNQSTVFSASNQRPRCGERKATSPQEIVSSSFTACTSLGNYSGYHPHRHHYHHFLRSITCTSSFSSSPSSTKTDHIYIRKADDDDNINNKRTVNVD